MTDLQKTLIRTVKGIIELNSYEPMAYSEVVYNGKKMGLEVGDINEAMNAMTGDERQYSIDWNR